jgi:Ca2+/Na+ antiporter
VKEATMRARTIFLILGIVLVAAFAALNVDEFMRPNVLSLGVTTVQVPLGMVMLVLLFLVMVVFLTATVYMQSVNLIETRQYARELNTQRDLAYKAEASRFTELRHYFEAQAAAAVPREAATATVLSERLAQTQQALLQRLEQSDRSMATHISALEQSIQRSLALSHGVSH